MIIRLANVVYWTAAAVSVIALAAIVVGAVLGTVDGLTQFTVGVLAFLIWLAGRTVLYVFADR